MAIWLAIISPYLAGVAGYFTLGWPIWPSLIISCAGACFWNWRAGLMLAAAVLLVQIAKAIYPESVNWVYYAAIYSTIGFIGAAFIDRLGGGIAFLVALAFLSQATSLNSEVVDAAAEIAFVLGLVGASYIGPSGGHFASVFGASSKHAIGRPDNSLGQHSRRLD